MAEFKPLRSKNVISTTHTLGSAEVEVVLIHDSSIVTAADKSIQIDRLMRNDDIVLDLFAYVRELQALTGRNIMRQTVIDRLKDVIISDYPVQVRNI